MAQMGLKQRLQADPKEALRDPDERAESLGRIALVAGGRTEIDKRSELEDSEVLDVVQRQANPRQEALKDLCDAGRDNSLAEVERDAVMVEMHLLKPLSRDGIADEACEAIAEVGATSIGPFERVIRELVPR